MIAGPATVKAPASGIWRIGRGDNPLQVRRPDPRTLGGSRTGNRFDSSTADYGVLYFSTTLEGCFGETLARLRPGTHLMAIIADEWHEMDFMEVGAVPADWRNRRSGVRVRLNDPDALFVDVEALQTHQHLRAELALGLASLGYDDLDVALLRGPDRRVTRLVSEWAWRQTPSPDDPTPVYAGIRYLSRLSNNWECWAVFDDAEFDVCETRPIRRDMPSLKVVAESYGLTVH